MGYLKAKNAPLFPTQGIHEYGEFLERSIKKIMNEYKHLKPECCLQKNRKKKKKGRDDECTSLLEKIEKEKHTATKKILEKEFEALFEKKSLEYQKKIITDLDEILKDDQVNNFIRNYQMFLPQRDILLESYVNKRLEQEINEIPADIKSKNAFEIKRSVLIKIRDTDTDELFFKETDTSSYLPDSFLKKNLEEKNKEYFPKEAYERKNAELYSTQNIARIIFNKRVKEKTWFDEKRQEHFFYENNHRVKSSVRELVKFVDTLVGLRDEWYFDALGTHEITTQQRLYDSVKKIAETDQENTKNGTLFNVDYRGIPENYNAKEFLKISNLADKYLRRIPNNEEEYKEAKEHLLKGIWIDHSRAETICMTPDFFRWYTESPISHGRGFLKSRDEKRQKKLKENCSDLVASYLETKFEKLYTN